MSSLPQHGRVNCTACYGVAQVAFDRTKHTEGNWRITANPLAWGNPEAEIVVLGFSKGPTQAGAIERTPHEEIAFKGSRLNVAKILAHVGLLGKEGDTALKSAVDKAISNKTGRFHFGSLIRCTVERYDTNTAEWKGTGGAMLDKFVATDFGRKVSRQCISLFLGNFPPQTKLVIMFGLGSKQNYVREAYALFQKVRPGKWGWINDVSYTDGRITVVHVEHFASRGALIPNWLGKNNHDRSFLGNMARSSVEQTLRKKINRGTRH
ncbi:MAG: hypothetical protein BWX92_03028 [Deltaproteobacteria bacterium ADurb.Bin135]|nr:MAG: hypothetical protein BWX92_03028 [Deltaproteobacteria bacterium ADurb.Bin135]